MCTAELTKQHYEEQNLDQKEETLREIRKQISSYKVSFLAFIHDPPGGKGRVLLGQKVSFKATKSSASYYKVFLVHSI